MSLGSLGKSDSFTDRFVARISSFESASSEGKREGKRVSRAEKVKCSKIAETSKEFDESDVFEAKKVGETSSVTPKRVPVFFARALRSSSSLGTDDSPDQAESGGRQSYEGSETRNAFKSPIRLKVPASFLFGNSFSDSRGTSMSLDSDGFQTPTEADGKKTRTSLSGIFRKNLTSLKRSADSRDSSTGKTRHSSSECATVKGVAQPGSKSDESNEFERAQSPS